MMERDFGFITMAFGPEKYIRQARALALSLRRSMPGYRLALVTDREMDDDLFDIVVQMEQIDLAGTVHKVDMYRYSPFAETLFIDSDCIAVRDFTPELEAISRFDFTPVVGTHLRDGDEDLWLDDVGQALRAVGGEAFPKFNGGVYFFRKGAQAEAVFRQSAAIRQRADEIGIKDFDASGPGEETLIGLALASLPAMPLYDDGGRLMRTPLNVVGKIEMDVLRGVCRFEKNGRIVEPAICHFCGPWIDHPAYRIAEMTLQRGRAVHPLRRRAIWMDHALATSRKRLRRLIGGASR